MSMSKKSENFHIITFLPILNLIEHNSKINKKNNMCRLKAKFYKRYLKDSGNKNKFILNIVYLFHLVCSVTIDDIERFKSNRVRRQLPDVEELTCYDRFATCWKSEELDSFLCGGMSL